MYFLNSQIIDSFVRRISKNIDCFIQKHHSRNALVRVYVNTYSIDKIDENSRVPLR